MSIFGKKKNNTDNIKTAEAAPAESVKAEQTEAASAAPS